MKLILAFVKISLFILNAPPTTKQRVVLDLPNVFEHYFFHLVSLRVIKKQLLLRNLVKVRFIIRFS